MKAAWFCQCERIEWPSNFRLDKFSPIQSNSIKFQKKWSLRQTLDVSNSKRMGQWFCQSKKFSAQTLMSSSSKILFNARDGNDRQTVHGNNSINSKTIFVSKHKTYLTPNEWVNTQRREFAEWKIKSNSPRASAIYCCGRVMDKTLTPSPWTTRVDSPNGLYTLKLTTPKNTIPNEYYLKF